ncbi:hypothetical protein SSX86_023558 [Deinandra increscens subsp. villosa]|uniref:Ubiquitin-like domain-containing protein n=1 Tax=Deinandra increscens subsp. villosa TaxID=3103831 RepID=A0AAP0CMI1_9ASTR
MADGSLSTNRKRKHTNHLYSVHDNNAPKMKLEFVREDEIGYGYFNDEKINVKMPSGEIKSLKVKQSDTFGKLKVKIQENEKIPFDHQELVYNGTVQLDKDTLSNLFIEKDIILTLMTKSNGLIKIFIDDTFVTHSINVKPDTTIGDVKSMVFGCFGWEVLVFNETVLEESGTLAEYNIIDGSILTVMGISMGRMDIKVDLYTGKTISLSVKPTYTVEDVKDDIQDEEDIPREEQVLMFDNMVLGEPGTLFDFGVTRNSTLKLMHRPWEFTNILSNGFSPFYDSLTTKVTTGQLLRPPPPLTLLFPSFHRFFHQICNHHQQSPQKNETRGKIMVQTRAKKAGKGKGIATGSSSTNRKGVGNDKSGNRKRKHTNRLDSITDNNAPKMTIELASLDASGYGYFNDNKINVEMPCGKMKTFKVKRSDSIGSIKVKIQAEEHIPFDRQELFNDGSLELDKDTLSNLYMKKDGFLTLMTKSNPLITILIDDFIRSYSIDVKPDITIGDVKSMCFGFFPEEQELVFNETVLDDRGTLSDYNVVDGSTLTVAVRSYGDMFVKLDMYTGKTVGLMVQATETVERVKEVIEEQEHVPRDEQVLIFENMVLGEGGTLFDFGVIRNSTLTLMHRPWELTTSRWIFVKNLAGEIITQEVKPSDTIAIVKAKIQDKVNVPFDEQELIFDGIVLSDIVTVADFHVNEESVLTLMHRPWGFTRFVQIFIKNFTGETITEEVKLSDTIGELKAKIQDKVDVPFEEQELIFNEMVLADADTLAEFNIKKESTLTLMRISSGLMRIFVKVLERETITLDVRPSNTIDDVKSMIFDAGKISRNVKDLCFLIFNGQRLEDNAILADYDIPKESMVHLIDRRDNRIREGSP